MVLVVNLKEEMMMEDRDLRRNEDTVMTDEEIMEKIRQDMDDIDVPDSISPLRMRQKLKSVKPDRKLVKFNRHRINVAGRVVAACFVGVVAIGAGTIAFVENQNASRSNEAVAVASEETAAACDDTIAETEGDLGLDSIGNLVRASSYEEIFEKFHEDSREMPFVNSTMKDGMGVVMEAADEDAEYESSSTVDMAAQDNSVGATTTAEKDGGYYSDTILQHEGVAEGDSIKTDGKYIYVLKQGLNKLFIIDSLDMREQAVIDYTDDSPEERYSVREFYYKDNRLYIVYEKRSGRGADIIGPVYNDLAEVDFADGQASVSDVEKLVEFEQRYVNSYKNTTQVDIYDIDDVTAPYKLNSFNQKGSYITSRMVGDRFYLMTNEMSYNYYTCWDKDYAIREENLDKWLPTVNDCAVEPNDIYYVDGSRGYQCISSFDVNSCATIDTKVIYDTFAQFYMTPDNLYVYENKYEDDVHYLADYSYDGNYDNYYKVSTEITKFDISGGEIVATAHNRFDGAISDTFAIRENGDYLYLILDIDETHYKDSWEPVTRKDWTDLYVVDKNLKILGGLSKIAPNEQVYAARFVGDIGYFVTYRNMDPLFTVDLSNPYNPKLIGELEIPGFSNYLHPWGDHNLVGIGEERDENSGFIGIKISLYDTTDPTNVVEVDKLVLDADEASAQYNYKELLCDYNIGLAGFSAVSYNWSNDDYNWETDEARITQNGYVFKIVDNKIIMDATIPLNEGNEYYTWGGSRMLYMNNCLYVTDEKSIRRLDKAQGYKELARFTFPEVQDDLINYPVMIDDGFYVD